MDYKWKGILESNVDGKLYTTETTQHTLKAFIERHNEAKDQYLSICI